MQTRRRGRQLVRLVVYSVCAAILIAALSLIVTTPFDQGTFVGVLGIVVAVVLFTSAELLGWARTPRRAKVVILAAIQSPFERLIERGLRDRLRGGCSFSAFFPPDIDQVAKWAGRMLEGQEVKSATVVVMRLNDFDSTLLSQIATSIRHGQRFVVISSDFPLQAFYDSRVEAPFLIQQNHRRAGAPIAEAVVGCLSAVRPDGIILMETPSSTVTGRIAYLANELLVRRLSVALVRIQRPESAEYRRSFVDALEAIDERVGSRAENLLVHPGNDAIVVDLVRFLREPTMISDPRLVGRRITWVGFDGLLDHDENFVLSDVPGAIATIDQKPYRIGLTVGDIVNDLNEHASGAPRRINEIEMEIVGFGEQPRSVVNQSR